MIKDYSMYPTQIINGERITKIICHSDLGIKQLVNDWNEYHPDKIIDLEECRKNIIIQPRS